MSWASFLTQEPSRDLWLYNIEEAKIKSLETGNPILISFSGSDWCLPCMRLHQTLFSDSTFIQYANESLVLLEVDFPSKKKSILSQEQLRHNEALSVQYNPKGSFPLVVIINGEGEVQGYMKHPAVSAAQYLQSIREIVE
jgi:thiol-disulfide isomerase/thioredoxin